MGINPHRLRRDFKPTARAILDLDLVQKKAKSQNTFLGSVEVDCQLTRIGDEKLLGFLGNGCTGDEKHHDKENHLRRASMVDLHKASILSVHMPYSVTPRRGGATALLITPACLSP